MTNRSLSSWVSTGLLAALCLAAPLAQAQVSVQGAWVRATVPQQKATGAFMVLTAAKDSQLLSVSSPVAGVAEVHEMTMDGGVMKMHPVASLALPAGKPVELKPGSYHLMLMDLKAQVKVGDSVPLTLTIKGADGKQDTLQIQAPARALGAAGEHAGHEHMHAQ